MELTVIKSNTKKELQYTFLKFLIKLLHELKINTQHDLKTRRLLDATTTPFERKTFEK